MTRASVCGWLLLLVILNWAPHTDGAAARVTPHSSGLAIVVPNARLVNIYWDAAWDTHVDDPLLTPSTD